MRLVIQNNLTKDDVIINDPKFIPRTGERIAGFYKPAPTVKTVIYDYKSETVFVVCE